MIALLIAMVMLQAPAEGGSVSGTVFTDAGQPARAARVELAGAQDGPLVMRTDIDGQFLFRNLKRGHYLLSVTKEGFVRHDFGQKKSGAAGTPIVIEAGTQVPDIVIRLQQAPSIVGEIRNEDEFPIANILVRALRRSYGIRGNRTLTLFSSTLTDDLGAYRLYWVDPGDYYVNATYLPQLPTPVNANEDSPRVAYSPTYFPGTTDPAEAQLVHLERDNGRSINLRLQRSPAVTVSGRVSSIVAGGPVRSVVTLMAPEESGSTVRYATQTDNKGQFEMKGVNGGTYVLSARPVAADGQVGYSRIVVLDIDRPRADVVIGPGVSLGIRLYGDVPLSVDVRTIRVSLVPLDTHIPPPEPAITLPNGVLTLTRVQPGDYALDVSGLPGNVYMKAARSGVRDVLEQFVNVQYESPTGLDIQLAFDGGQIAGTLTDAAGRPVGEGTIALVPDVTRRHRPDQYRVVSPTAAGRFSIEGIPSGEYKLFAWESVETNAWVNADFISSYEELGTAVTVSPNAQVSAQLRVIAQGR